MTTKTMTTTMTTVMTAATTTGTPGVVAGVGGFKVHAVADATGACLDQLRPARFTDLTAGRLGVAARPGMRRASWLATDILTALGCLETVTGAGRPGEADPLVAATWLRTHRIGHLYVQFAWDISHPALTAAAELAKAAQLTLWLVGDSPYTEYREHTLSEYQPQEWTAEEFLDHWRHLTAVDPAGSLAADVLTGPDEGRAADPLWPATLPNDDFTTFRAACRDRLRPTEFALVDACFLDAHRDATTDLLPLLTADEPHPSDGLEGSVAGWLAARWETAETLGHFLVVMRAAQVAAFNAGYLLQVDLDQLIGTAATTPRRAQRSERTWARLRAYPQPYRAAVCALAAAGMGVDPMTALPVNAYTPATGVIVDAAGHQFTVEPAARIFLEAQQTLRRLSGAAETDLLLVNPADGKPFAGRTLSATVRLARRELGAAVALAAPDRTTPDPSRWYRRWGVSIQELT